MANNLEHTKEDLQRTVREILRVVIQRRWSFFIPFCLAATVVFVGSHSLPRVYRTETVFERISTIPIANVLNREGPMSINALRQTMESDMFGEQAMLRVAEKMGRTQRLPKDENGQLTTAGLAEAKRLAKGLRGKVSYSLVGEPNDSLDRIKIIATSDDPNEIVALANATLENYVQTAQERFRNKLQDAVKTYDEQVEEQMILINQKEGDLERLETEAPCANRYTYIATGQEVNSLTNACENLKVRITEYDRELAALESQLNATPVPKLVQDSLRTHDPASQDTESSLASERQRLRTLLQESENRLMRYQYENQMTEVHPAVVKERTWRQQMFDQLEQVELKLASFAQGAKQYTDNPAQVEVLNTSRQNLETKIEIVRANRTDAERTLAEKSSELDSKTVSRESGRAKTNLYNTFSQDIESAKKNLGMLRDNRQSIVRVLNVDARDQGIRFNTVSAAETAKRPILPSARTIVLLALGVGLAFGACSVFVREFFDHTYQTSNAVSVSLGIPILESIDEIILAADRRRLLLRRLVAVPVACLFLAVAMGSGMMAYLSIEDPPLYHKIVYQTTHVLGNHDSHEQV